MNRLERTIFNKGTHLGEKGFSFISGVGGGLVGAGIGIITGLASSGVSLGVGLDKGWKLGKSIGNKLGKVIGGTIGSVLRRTKDLGNLINNPFDELSNALIRFLVNLLGLGFFLDDLIADKIIENKTQILLFILSIVLSFAMVFVSIEKSIYVFAGGSLGEDGVLQKSVYDLNISNSVMPVGSPLGGNGLENTQITVSFQDQGYYNTFGKWHEALDIIPSSNYYKTDKAYLEKGYTYIYATCDGIANSYLDKAGAIVIEIECDDKLHKVLMAHESFSFIPINSNYRLVSGQAIGIMGCTGKCYGAHVHYAIYLINSKGNYDAVDPTKYI